MRGKSFANSTILCIPVEKFRDSNNALLIPVLNKNVPAEKFRDDDSIREIRETFSTPYFSRLRYPVMHMAS